MDKNATNQNNGGFSDNGIPPDKIPTIVNMRNPNDKQINIKLTYPHDDKFDYTTQLMRLDLDKEREIDIRRGKGFIITAPKGIKKDIKLANGIFSSIYGSNSISDVDSFNGRYRCKCGKRRGSIYHGEICPVCGERVKYVDDDVSITGYLKLKDRYWIIHPNMYRIIEHFIGSGVLNRIIEPDIQVDINGNEIEPELYANKKEPFKGIGLMRFYDHFDEIMEYYYAKLPAKKIYYNDIMERRDIIFTHTISVYSSLLRPSSIDNGTLRYEACNDQFNMLAKLVYSANEDELEIDRRIKEKLQILYNIQYQLNEVYNQIRDILASKKGDLRSAIGGRYSFSSRSVIKQDVNLKADEVRLPFHGLCELLQQVIINILVKSYQISYSAAYKKWYKAQITGYDKVIWDIIDGLIKDSPYGGLPVLINVSLVL